MQARKQRNACYCSMPVISSKWCHVNFYHYYYKKVTKHPPGIVQWLKKKSNMVLNPQKIDSRKFINLDSQCCTTPVTLAGRSTPTTRLSSFTLTRMKTQWGILTGEDPAVESNVVELVWEYWWEKSNQCCMLDLSCQRQGSGIFKKFK